jgi:hypothetical protein
MAQVIEYLPSKPEALISNFSTTKTPKPQTKPNKTLIRSPGRKNLIIMG